MATFHVNLDVTLAAPVPGGFQDVRDGTVPGENPEFGKVYRIRGMLLTRFGLTIHLEGLENDDGRPKFYLARMFQSVGTDEWLARRLGELGIQVGVDPPE